MMRANLNEGHGYVTSSVLTGSVSGVYTTTSTNEVITFAPTGGTNTVDLNSITIYAQSTTLQVRINATSQARLGLNYGSFFIANGSSKSISGFLISDIQIIGASGQQIMYEGVIF